MEDALGEGSSAMGNRHFVSAQRRYDNARVRDSEIQKRLCYDCGEIVNGGDREYQEHILVHEAVYLTYQLYHFERNQASANAEAKHKQEERNRTSTATSSSLSSVPTPPHDHTVAVGCSAAVDRPTDASGGKVDDETQPRGTPMASTPLSSSVVGLSAPSTTTAPITTTRSLVLSESSLAPLTATNNVGNFDDDLPRDHSLDRNTNQTKTPLEAKATTAAKN